MKLPRMFKVRQRFPAGKLDDVCASLGDELKQCDVTVRPGARITIAVGSRGIANLPLIVREVVACVRAYGGEPFIIPAMGSHGGATAQGQRKVLENYGIDAAPIVSSMEVVQLGPDTYMDKVAFESDGIIVINRVKPHTSFHGVYESGLLKMIAIGLGKDAGARALHAHGVEGLRHDIPRVAREILATGKILFGVAIVENAYDQTMVLRAIPAARLPDEEPALLELARANMPNLPVNELDVLVVDEIGKDISGTGMDTNVIGRLRIAGQPEPTSPRIKRIVVLDLSDSSGGSAYGIGLSDVTTRRLAEKTDWQVTNANVAASGFIERGKLPHVADTDEAALEFALRGMQPDGARIIRIKNTLHLDTMLVSASVLEEIRDSNQIRVIGPAPSFFASL